MYEIRIHGLGGQGVVTMTDILALACFYEGKQVQAFPHFGPERTGAPVTGFIRLDDKQINLKQQIYSPDLIIVLDDSLLDKKVNISAGAKTGTKLLINTKRPSETLSALVGLPAKAISVCQPDPALGKSANIFILGQAAKLYNLASLNNCSKAVKLKMSGLDKNILKNNLNALKQGYA